uniref:Transmembrane protein 34 n=1 Tax=Caenorhabditis tropicalis TaxID=1561998 RepID=A0A1I7UYP4_9PELO
MEKAILKFLRFILVAIAYAILTLFVYIQIRFTELIENSYVTSTFYTLSFFLYIPIWFKLTELSSKCPPEFKAWLCLKEERSTDVIEYATQVSLIRFLALLNQILAILRPIIAHFLPEASIPLACQLYFSLLQPTVAEVMAFILSLQVKEGKPKPSLWIDFIFLIILTAVLFLGNFSLPCLFICAFIIIIFELIQIIHILNAKIVMKNQIEAPKRKTVLPRQTLGPIETRIPLETPPVSSDLLEREAEIREFYNQCVNNSKLMTETSSVYSLEYTLTYME